jgi:hypothetical protein
VLGGAGVSLEGFMMALYAVGDAGASRPCRCSDRGRWRGPPLLRVRGIRHVRQLAKVPGARWGLAAGRTDRCPLPRRRGPPSISREPAPAGNSSRHSLLRSAVTGSVGTRSRDFCNAIPATPEAVACDTCSMPSPPPVTTRSSCDRTRRNSCCTSFAAGAYPSPGPRPGRRPIDRLPVAWSARRRRGGRLRLSRLCRRVPARSRPGPRTRRERHTGRRLPPAPSDYRRMLTPTLKSRSV